MKNYVQAGDTLTVPAPTGGVSSGDVVAIGKLVGVAVTDAAEGDSVAVMVEGVFSVPVAAADDVGVGDTLYWDVADGEFNKSASGNIKSGYATQAAGVGVATGEIRLTPGVA